MSRACKILGHVCSKICFDVVNGAAMRGGAERASLGHPGDLKPQLLVRFRITIIPMHRRLTRDRHLTISHHH